MTIQRLPNCTGCGHPATGVYNGRLGCCRCDLIGPSIHPAPTVEHTP